MVLQVEPIETRLTELERREITSKKTGNETLAVELKDAVNVRKNWQQIGIKAILG